MLRPAPTSGLNDLSVKDHWSSLQFGIQYSDVAYPLPTHIASHVSPQTIRTPIFPPLKKQAHPDPTAELSPGSDSEPSEMTSSIPQKRSYIAATESLKLLQNEAPSPALSNRSALSDCSTMNTATEHVYLSLTRPHHPSGRGRRNLQVLGP